MLTGESVSSPEDSCRGSLGTALRSKRELRAREDRHRRRLEPSRRLHSPSGIAVLHPLFYTRLMSERKIRLQVNVAIAAEAEGGRFGEGFQVAVCTGVVEQAF